MEQSEKEDKNDEPPNVTNNGEKDILILNKNFYLIFKTINILLFTLKITKFRNF